jgi:hypothetical protein
MLPRGRRRNRPVATDLEGLLEAHGFDRVQHEQIQADLRGGRIGLAQNRLPASSKIEDAGPDAVLDATARCRPLITGDSAWTRWRMGAVAVVSLAGGVGSRWTKGAGVVKALNPFSPSGRQAPQLHRSAPGQEPAGGPRQAGA